MAVRSTKTVKNVETVSEESTVTVRRTVRRIKAAQTERTISVRTIQRRIGVKNLGTVTIGENESSGYYPSGW